MKWKPNKQQLNNYLNKKQEREQFIKNNADLFNGVIVSKNLNTFYYEDFRISTHSKSRYSTKLENLDYDFTHLGTNKVTNSFKNMVKILAQIKNINLNENDLINL